MSQLKSNPSGDDNLPPVAFVTGAGSGIGAAIAERFAKEGWDLVLVGRRQDALEETAKRISHVTGRPYTATTTIPIDISSTDSVATLNRWIKTSEAVSCRIRCLIHNAGIYERASTLASTDMSWHRVFETNLFAVIRLTQTLYPCLKQNQGSVIAVSSTLGLRPVKETGAYSASKAALNSWVQTFALESAVDQVRVNAICPGIVDTPIHDFHNAPNRQEALAAMASLQPLGRIGKPADIANMVWNLAAPGSEWITGALIPVDGGISLV
jgi:NAD(P)-dependent dehydrogenase (short-subunit alcohol dehydrogenase family)